MIYLIKKKIAMIQFEILFTIALYVSISQTSVNYSSWLVCINIITLVALLHQILGLKYITQKWINIEILFITFTYLFLLSYQFLLLISFDFGTMSYANPIVRNGESTYVWSTSFSLMAIQFLYIGILLNNVKKSNINKKISNHTTYADVKLYSDLLMLIAISSNVYQFIYLNNYSAYRGTTDLNNGSLIVQIVSYLTYTILPAFFLKVLYHKGNKLFTRILLISFCLIEIIMMFTGVRAESLINIIIFVFLYYQFIEKLKIRNYIQIFIVGIILLYILVIIRNGRNTGDYFNAALSINTNVILNTMSEFGFTINTLCVAKNSTISHKFGSQFMYSLMAVIPKISHIAPDLANANIYNALNLSSYGSSYITDFYYDFGMYSIIVYVCFGYFIESIFKKVRKYFWEEDFLKFACILPLLSRLIFFVRSGTVNLPRIFLWTYIIMRLLCLVAKLFTRRLLINRNCYKET